MTNGLQGLYQSNFAIFVATNFTDMRQKSDSNVNLTTEQPLLGGTVQLNPDGVPRNTSTPEGQASQ